MHDSHNFKDCKVPQKSLLAPLYEKRRQNNTENRLLFRPTSKSAKYMSLSALPLQLERDNNLSDLSGLLMTYFKLHGSKEVLLTFKSKKHHSVFSLYLNKFSYAISFYFCSSFLAFSKANLSHNSKERVSIYLGVLFPSEFLVIMSLLTFNF